MKLEQILEKTTKEWGEYNNGCFHSLEETKRFVTEVWNEAVEATKIKNKETIEYYQLRARNEAINYQGKRAVTLYQQALGDTKLPEDIWKKIAKVNQLILDK